MNTVAVRSDNLHGMYALEVCVLCPRLDGLAGDLLCLLAVHCNLCAQRLKLVHPLISCSHMFCQACLQLFGGVIRVFDLRRQGSGSLELLSQGVQFPVLLLKLVALFAAAQCELQLVLLRFPELDGACQTLNLHQELLRALANLASWLIVHVVVGVWSWP